MSIPLGCHRGSKVGHSTASSAPIEILSIKPSTYSGRGGTTEEQACKEWRLSKAQARRFFGLSKEYSANPYHAFYQLNCSITGQLKSGGKTWAFGIDGGGTATWRSGRTTRYWGCSTSRCEPLVILLTDGMEG
ncbi:hypothetical protein P8609_13485 [Lysobacter sp. UC]|uniref:Uncharacterized protein n=1 Tax=Lysobacter arvi TaxID=3038776 RepID=A0ABU1CG94_9GAMM|nr:hypothetical protein [Lysobacter arvi]